MRCVLAVLLLIGIGGTAAGQKGAPLGGAARAVFDRQVAAQFAPIFQQGLGDAPRGDYITNFDFDGDWKGDNNWRNLDNAAYALRAYIYYSVSETPTHYFIHYAVFHPRDYKGGVVKSTVLSAIIQAGIETLGRDPTDGLADEVALSHENDLEGCLVVAAKRGADYREAVVEYVETMAHNRYLKYRPAGSMRSRAGAGPATEAQGAAIGEEIPMRDGRPVLFIEPKGHGIEGWMDDPAQLAQSVNGVMTYVYAGRADDPEKAADRAGEIGYDLLPIRETFWKRAQAGTNETYGEASVYSGFTLALSNIGAPAKTTAAKTPAGKSAANKNAGPSLGSALRGQVGFPNKARPPWGWFDSTERERPLGEWFFDPASTIKRHFKLGDEFSTVYGYNPYLKTPPGAAARKKQTKAK